MKTTNAILLLLVMTLITSCGVVQGEVSFIPAVLPFLEIAINTQGEISFESADGIKIPITPLGTLVINASLNPSEYFKVENTLTVRMNDKDHVYDLQGQDFDVRLQSGFYKKISLIKTGKNLFIEVVRVETADVNVPPPQASEPPTQETTNVVVTSAFPPTPTSTRFTEASVVTSNEAYIDFLAFCEEAYFDFYNRRCTVSQTIFSNIQILYISWVYHGTVQEGYNRYWYLDDQFEPGFSRTNMNWKGNGEVDSTYVKNVNGFPIGTYRLEFRFGNLIFQQGSFTVKP